MNGDTLELAQMISTAQTQLSAQINEVATKVAGLHGTYTAEIQAVKDDISDVKKGIADDRFWTNVKAYSGPVLVALHIAAKKIGINV